MLATYYLFDETLEINRQMQQAGMTEQQAARCVLGVGYEEIGIASARSWTPAVTRWTRNERSAAARPSAARARTET